MDQATAPNSLLHAKRAPTSFRLQATDTDRLERIQARHSIGRSDAARQALQIYDRVLAETAAGADVVVRRTNGERLILLERVDGATPVGRDVVMGRAIKFYEMLLEETTSRGSEIVIKRKNGERLLLVVI